MRNILISSSSFLHETNESWDKISKNFNTEFSPHNKMFYSRKEHFAEINMVFLADILDHFDSRLNLPNINVLKAKELVYKASKNKDVYQSHHWRLVVAVLWSSYCTDIKSS